MRRVKKPSESEHYFVIPPRTNSIGLLRVRVPLRHLHHRRAHLPLALPPERRLSHPLPALPIQVHLSKSVFRLFPTELYTLAIIRDGKGGMRFDPERFEITAGQTVEVVIHNNESNTSGQTHNWVLIKPGSKPAVVALGINAGVDPGGATYSPSILAATRSTKPGESSTVDFIAPDTPGNYPYISLTGEQWKQLHGTVVVVPSFPEA